MEELTLEERVIMVIRQVTGDNSVTISSSFEMDLSFDPADWVVLMMELYMEFEGFQIPWESVDPEWETVGELAEWMKTQV